MVKRFEPLNLPAMQSMQSMHSELWHAATRHRFLDAVRDSTIARPAFDAWLAQDYRFVVGLLSFQARLLARAPRAAQAALAGGLVVLVEELVWFEQLAAERGLDLAQPALAATEDYLALLHRLDEAPVPTALAALWVIERVYLEAWTYAASEASAYADYVEHWTAPGFADYVDALADVAAGGVVDETLLVQVLKQEIAFWEMAFAKGNS